LIGVGHDGLLDAISGYMLQRGKQPAVAAIAALVFGAAL